MPKVFISYARAADAAFAAHLATRLRQAGINAWLDVEQITAGDNVDQKLRAAIDDADCAIFLISHPSVDHDYTTKELKLVAARDATGEHIRRIGVLRAP